MKKLFLYLSVVLGISMFFVSCGGNENDDDLIGEGITSSIIVSSNKFNIVLAEEDEEQESFVFSVTSNNGVNITDFCTFYLNGEELESNVFTPEELGTYEVTARYDNLETNTLTINVVDIASTYF